MTRVAVIGAGIAGLTTAYRLVAQGTTVDVYERWPGLGGMAATLDVGDGHLLERYYHHLYTSDRHIADLWAEVGLPDELDWLTSSMANFSRGQAWSFTTPQDLLRFKPLPFASRVRMGAAVVALQRFASDPEPYEGMTARAWIERNMGKAAWRVVWGPMLRGKFGDRAEDIAMVWLWSKWRLRRQVSGDEAREERLGYPKGSWETLLAALQTRIEAGGGKVHIDRPVARLGRTDAGFVLTPGAPGSFRRGLDPRAFDTLADETYDGVVCTTGGDLFAGMLDDGLTAALGTSYLRRCRDIEYHGALCLLLELDRQYSPYYWTNVLDERLPFIGLIEHTNFVSPERYDGRRFLYVANYLDNADPLMALSLDELITAYEPGLQMVTPAFDRRWIRNAWMFREPHGQPIVTIGYRDRLPAMRTPVPGLVHANIAHVYPEDRGTNYAVRLGGQAAIELLASLPPVAVATT